MVISIRNTFFFTSSWNDKNFNKIIFPILFQGCTLLIDAIKRGDGFAAQFLLDKDCDVNLKSKGTADTALHLVCTYSEKSCDKDTFKDMMLVAESLLQKSADPNLQNRQG